MSKTVIIVVPEDVSPLVVMRDHEWVEDGSELMVIAVPLVSPTGTSYMAVTNDPELIGYEYLGDAVDAMDAQVIIWGKAPVGDYMEFLTTWGSR